MRRILTLSRGVLELGVAVILLLIIGQLPGPSDVADGLGRVGQVSTETSEQIKHLQGQLQTLRSRQPQVRLLAAQLRTQMTALSGHLKNQHLDYVTVRNISKALGDVAQGLDTLGDTLAPRGIGQVTSSLQATADYLDSTLVPATAAAAVRVEKASNDVRADARRLRKLLRAAPVGLAPLQQLHDSLARLSKGLDHVNRMIQVENVDAVREGLRGMEESLTTGADQVERLSGYHYPMVTFAGVKPVVEQKAFWPEGDKIALGMRKAARGVASATKSLRGMTDGLPKVREALTDSRKAAETTRSSLATLLENRDQIEPVIANLPEHVARLAEELPQAGLDLARLLKDMSRLKEVARALRSARQGMEAASTAWPAVRKSLNRSSVLLRATQDHLQEALAHEKDFNASLKHTLLLTETFSAALPLLTEKVDEDLQEQDISLSRLSGSIDNVTAVLPMYSQRSARLILLARLLLGLIAAIFVLHGGYVIHGVLREPRPV